MSAPKAKEKPLVISINDEIRFKALDDTPGGGNLGRAEFQFCPIWRKGKMAELMIFRRQQREEVRAYRLKLLRGITQFSFQGPYEDKPNLWHMFWCEEHETVCYRVYVPTHSSRIAFEPHFGNSIDIRFW